MTSSRITRVEGEYVEVDGTGPLLVRSRIRRRLSGAAALLRSAAAAGETNIVKALIAHGVDAVTSISQNGMLNSALHIATQAGEAECAQVLLDAGCNRLARNARYTSPEQIARSLPTSAARAAMVRVFFPAATENLAKLGQGSLAEAIRAGDASKVDRLLKEGNEEEKKVEVMKSRTTPLMVACYHGMEVAVRSLLAKPEEGGQVNDRSDQGCVPLHFAADHGASNVIAELVRAGASVNETRDDGVSPLWVAAHNGHTEVIAEFIKAGANINQADKDGKTPLFAASINGHAKAVELLLGAGAGAVVNKPGSSGKTPLYTASQHNHVEVAKALLAHDADVNLPAESGRTPLHAASRDCHVDVMRQLLEAKAVVDVKSNSGATALFWASFNGHQDAIEALLNARAEVNQADKKGWTPLNVASHNGHKDAVERLLDAGADPNQENLNGWTPLFAASRTGHGACVRLLLRHGADMERPMRDNGWTPLFVAAWAGYADVVKSLKNKGARDDVLSTCEHLEISADTTPLTVAVKRGHTVIVGIIQGTDISTAPRWVGGVLSTRQIREEVAISRPAAEGRGSFDGGLGMAPIANDGRRDSEDCAAADGGGGDDGDALSRSVGSKGETPRCLRSARGGGDGGGERSATTPRGCGGGGGGGVGGIRKSASSTL